MTKRQQIHREFLEKWPIERLEKLSLEEYALGNKNYKETFSYWVETETQNLGRVSGLGGGGSFKHGIFYMSNKKPYENQRYRQDEKYAWLSKYGETESEAFKKIRSILIRVAKASVKGDFQEIESVEFYATIKWKWAFLYSSETILPAYSKPVLLSACEAEKMRYGEGFSEDHQIKSFKSNEIKSFDSKKSTYLELYSFLNKKLDFCETRIEKGDLIWGCYLDSQPPKGNYFLIGSKYGENDNMDVFPDMFRKNVISTGFYFEDLSFLVGRPKNEIKKFLKEREELPKSYNCLKEFLNIKPGDKIAIKGSGNPKNKKAYLSIVGICEVKEVDDFYNFDDETLGHTLKVNWINAPIFEEFDFGGFSRTLHKLSDAKVIRTIFENQFDELELPLQSEKINRMKPILNQILFGPPGTGKTYSTIEKAIQIIDSGFDLNQSRKEVKAKYDELHKAGRIVFTTFHQSMSYEDFVEGIKPNLESIDSENISYKIEDGIFKKVCIEAGYEFVKQQSSQTSARKIISFEQAYINFYNEIADKLEHEKEVKIPLRSGGEILIIETTSQENFKMRHVDREREYTVSKNRAERLFNEIENFETIQNVNSFFRGIIGGSNTSAYWAVLNQIYQRIDKGVSNVNLIEVTYESKKSAVQKIDWSLINSTKESPSYVLIIDEINRGNVSSIFGELITLIEDDKRAGSDETLKVKLPYSKKNFSVPLNLHIIGTMNTADRSVEALDSALRRRFAFEEISSNPSLLSSKAIITYLWNIEEYAELGWNDSPYLEHANTLYKFLGVTKSKAESDAMEMDGTYNKTNWSVKDLDYLSKEDFNGIDLELLLKTINNRIRVLLDKDHQIGHAYFINIYKSLNPRRELKLIFQNKIIPLLQEYFYGNYGKIERIIGTSFFENTESDSVKFADGDYDIGDYSERKVYVFKNLEEMSVEEFLNAVNKITQ